MIELHKLASLLERMIQEKIRAKDPSERSRRKIQAKDSGEDSRRPDQTKRLMAPIVNLVNGINFMVIYCRLAKRNLGAKSLSGAIAIAAHSSPTGPDLLDDHREIVYHKRLHCSVLAL